MQDRPQSVMSKYGRIIEHVLREYDSRLNNNLSSLSFQILKNSDNDLAISQRSSNTFIPPSQPMSNWDTQNEDKLESVSMSYNHEKFQNENVNSSKV